MAISVGSAAPDFTLKDQNQKEVKLSDFKGKKNVVVVFYPLDWSPVCTNEHACFVNDMKRFEQLDAQVLGVSVDSAWSHKAFAEKMGIGYPLLADFQPRGAVGENSEFIWPTRASPAGPSPLSTRREMWRGSRTTTFQPCRISTKFPVALSSGEVGLSNFMDGRMPPSRQPRHPTVSRNGEYIRPPAIAAWA